MSEAMGVQRMQGEYEEELGHQRATNEALKATIEALEQSRANAAQMCQFQAGEIEWAHGLGFGNFLGAMAGNDQLDEENNSLEEKNNSLEEENDSLEEKNISLEEKNNSLEEKNNLLGERNNSLEGENNSLVEKNNSLQERNNSLGERNNQLKDVQGRLVEWYVKLETEREDLEKEKSSWVMEKAQMMAKMARMEAEASSHEHKIAELKVENEAHKAAALQGTANLALSEMRTWTAQSKDLTAMEQAKLTLRDEVVFEEMASGYRKRRAEEREQDRASKKQRR